MTKISVAVIFGLAMIGAATPSAALPKPGITDFNRNGSQLPFDVASVSYNVTSNVPYHGWANALHISNGMVEATIVPDVGRIMQFGYVGTSGVFWQDRTKDGQVPNLAPGSAYKNFGGDKIWPAPQSDWSAIIDGQSGNWPPPTTFEAMTSHVSVSGAEVVMKSAVDPYFGIQVTRRIHLLPGEPRMRVTTTFNQVENITNQVSIWIVSQFADPEMVFVPIAENSMFPNGYHTIYSTPPDLKVSKNLISFTHNVSGNKIGSDSERLLGLGADYSLEVSAPRIPGVAYPDSGSSVEVYTASDYVELEVLGPLTQLLPGESISLGMNYTLHPRVLSDPQLEAERILGNR